MVTAERKKEKKEWILITIFIGLFSLIGLYIVGDLIISLLLVIILAICYTYINKLPINRFFKIFGFSILILVIAFAFIIAVIYLSDQGSIIEITSHDIQGYEYIVNITKDEIREYPVLQQVINDKMVNDVECKKHKENQWICKVNPDDWHGIKNLIDGRAIKDSTGIGTCYKLGENYGEKCFTFGFLISD